MTRSDLANLFAAFLTAIALCSILHAEENLATTAGSREVRKLMNERKHEEAYEQAESQVAINPDSAEAHYWLGAAAGTMAQNAGMLSKLGYAKDCKNAFEKAAELDKNHVQARFALIQFHKAAPGIAGGDEDRVPVLIKEISAVDPVAGFRSQAIVSLMDKDKVSAEKFFRQALSLNPADVDTVEAMVGGYLNDKRIAEAETVLLNAVAKTPAVPRLRYQQAKFAAIAGKDTEAGLKIIDELLAMPQFPERLNKAGVYWRRAQLLEKLGRIAEAKASMAKSVELEPKAKELKAELVRINKLPG